MKMMTWDDFFAFLEKHGAKERFLKNSDSNIGISGDTVDRYELMSHFEWYGSPEGSDYWSDLSDKWKFLYDNPTPLHRFLAGIEEDGQED